jgi:hypothetical protein
MIVKFYCIRSCDDHPIYGYWQKATLVGNPFWRRQGIVAEGLFYVVQLPVHRKCIVREERLSEKEASHRNRVRAQVHRTCHGTQKVGARAPCDADRAVGRTVNPR